MILVFTIISLVHHVFFGPEDTKVPPLQQGDLIEWFTWDKGMDMNKTNPKLLLVDIYSEQCKYCKLMDERTLVDSNVVHFINENFYAVKLDAKGKRPLIWNGDTYHWDPARRGGIHMLAYALCYGEPSFPAFVILSAKGDQVHITKGFKNQGTFLNQLKLAVSKAEDLRSDPGR